MIFSHVFHKKVLEKTYHYKPNGFVKSLNFIMTSIFVRLQNSLQITNVKQNPNFLQ